MYRNYTIIIVLVIFYFLLEIEYDTFEGILFIGLVLYLCMQKGTNTITGGGIMDNLKSMASNAASGAIDMAKSNPALQQLASKVGDKANGAITLAADTASLALDTLPV